MYYTEKLILEYTLHAKLYKKLFRFYFSYNFVINGFISILPDEDHLGD